jgi:hypothetical protein
LVLRSGSFLKAKATFLTTGKAGNLCICTLPEPVSKRFPWKKGGVPWRNPRGDTCSLLTARNLANA